MNIPKDLQCKHVCDQPLPIAIIKNLCTNSLFTTHYHVHLVAVRTKSNIHWRFTKESHQSVAICQELDAAEVCATTAFQLWAWDLSRSMLFNALRTHVVACQMQCCLVCLLTRPQMPRSCSDRLFANIASETLTTVVRQSSPSLETNPLESVATETLPCIRLPTGGVGRA